jgi:hypothetical protein
MLVFFRLHVLMLWLHPLGARAFFANLFLGAVAAWLIVPHCKVALLPRYVREASESVIIEVWAGNAKTKSDAVPTAESGAP